MWICGAGTNHPEYFESGIVEEIKLRNLYYNAEMKYPIWDDVLYGICREEPLLETILSCSVTEVRSVGRKINSVLAWHLTRQCWMEVEAQMFADCSGDSILRYCGAETRIGRESKHEFNESNCGEEADEKTMGNSILIQLRETDKHIPFRPPVWARKFTDKDAERREMKPTGHNFWWLEFGGIYHTIEDADKIRDENMAIAYGAWEYIKNHPDGRGHHWELEWIGSLPGKRENYRYIGDYILTQNDIENGGKNFPDVIAHGGWPMDDHHPEAIYDQAQATIFYPAPKCYGIPYRILYSKDMDNLFVAGRNVSCTHMAMSSTRVMGTTGVMGQAVGTAAALAIDHHLSTREIYNHKIKYLKDRLKLDDQFLPWEVSEIQALKINGKLEILNNSKKNIDDLINGIDRKLTSHGQEINSKKQKVHDSSYHWMQGENSVLCQKGAKLKWNFEKPVYLSQVQIISDSDFAKEKRLPCSFPKAGNLRTMPELLLKDASIEYQNQNGKWIKLKEIKDNFLRQIKIQLPKNQKIFCQGVRLNINRSWGEKDCRIFRFDLW